MKHFDRCPACAGAMRPGSDVCSRCVGKLREKAARPKKRGRYKTRQTDLTPEQIEAIYQEQLRIIRARRKHEAA